MLGSGFFSFSHIWDVQAPTHFNHDLYYSFSVQLVGQEKREAEALKLFHEEQSKKQAQELLEQYLTYKKVRFILDAWLLPWFLLGKFIYLLLLSLEQFLYRGCVKVTEFVS